ncbi:hypothetical protein R3X25_02285 [Lutibacter sp. TH_r2]|uniref:hypothetical protein n=1 Tax=Lutibacter sp. TH_r2 TaxID=3082083 RepID=UPI002953757D|nr:hypothetical protein [Lutibacter sp. TH_r2]MDV7186097.1 hypothetical protein [Lutibacter sp. TH_r2]
MNALFIWREESRKYINKLSKKIDNKVIVCNNESFQNLEINDFECIFILVELNWENNPFYGYEVASSIVMNWRNDENPPNIQFFSFISQLSLFNQTKDVDKFFVKSFKHHSLPFNEGINLKTYSKSKWKYLKKYALTKSGILETINHDLKNDLNKSQLNFEDIFISYKERLLGIKSLLNPAIINLLSSQKLSSNQKLNELHLFLNKRLRELNILDENKPIEYNGVKEKILLVEDDKEFGKEIKAALDIYFDVNYKSNGLDAIKALEIGGDIYQGLITDLELLDENQIDQPVQGIELIEYVSNSKKHKHIVKRIVSGLPRKGISELVNMDINDILYKSVIAFYGFSEGFDIWVKKLKNDIKAFRSLKYMKGPEKKIFWQDTKKEVDKKGEVKITGSGFKRFYYNLQIEESQIFKEMWSRIETKVLNILNDETSEIIETKFIKIDDRHNFLEKNTKENSVALLEQILTHRLLWISFFNDKDQVVYKDNSDINNSWSHKPFWKENYNRYLKKNTTLSVKPDGDFGLLGFTTIQILPKEKKLVLDEVPKVIIQFQTNQLFIEEEKFKLNYNSLLKSSVNDFAQKYIELCELTYWWIANINLAKENKLNAPLNFTDYTEEKMKQSINDILFNAKSIKKEYKTVIKNEIIEYQDSKEFNNLSKNLQNLLNNIISNNTLD